MSWYFLTESPPHPAIIPATFVLFVCWATLTGLGLRALPELRRTWTGELATQRHLVLALTLFAIALRLWWAPIGPELRWRLDYAFSDFFVGMGDVRKYGLGHPLLLRWLLPLVGGTYDALFALQAVIGGLGVLPMVGLVRALGGRFETSLWCGFAFAVTPLLVRFGHTDSPFPVDALFSLLTFLGVARYARDLDDRWLLVALASVVTVAQMRLESIADAGLALLLAVALSPGFPWRDRRTWSAVLAAIVLLVPHAWLMADQLLYELSYRYDDVEEQRDRFGLTHYLFFNPTMQARLLIVALPLGLLHAELSWRVRLWAFASMMLVGSVLLTAHPHETSYAIARYQLRAMPHAALLAGLGMAWLVNRFPSPVMRLALIGGCLASLPMAARPSLLTREHEVFREHLPAVGSPCTVLTLLDDKDTTLAPPVHLSKLGGYDHVWLDVTRDAVPTEGCVAYWKSSTCTMHYLTPAVQTGDRAPACADFERAWMLEPIGEAELEPDPYGPMGLRVQRPDELVPVGFYRVTGRRLLP